MAVAYLFEITAIISFYCSSQSIIWLCLHRFQTDPNGCGPKIEADRLPFTRDRSGTGPERIQNWTCRFAGPVLQLDPFWNRGPGPIPCKHILNVRIFCFLFRRPESHNHRSYASLGELHMFVIH